MKIYLAVILIAFSSTLFGGELPPMLKMRIDQMNLPKRDDVKLSEKWPDEPSGLFQGIRKEVDIKISSKKDHLVAIAGIPKHLIKDRVIGETVESDGWFYTSVVYKGWKEKETSWFNVIASAKGSNVLCFSYTW
jgi:hypothetical protein